MSFLKELVQFLMARKKYWLVPIFLVLFVDAVFAIVYWETDF